MIDPPPRSTCIRGQLQHLDELRAHVITRVVLRERLGDDERDDAEHQEDADDDEGDEPAAALLLRRRDDDRLGGGLGRLCGRNDLGAHIRSGALTPSRPRPLRST
jgi:hypothetical protein